MKETLVGLLKDWGLALGIGLVVLLGWEALNPGVRGDGPAPALVLPDAEGGTSRLGEPAYETYVVNFWATWCGPCRKEIPEITAFQRDHPEVKVVGVSVDRDMSTRTVGQAAKRLGADYQILHDVRGQEATRWGVSVYPTTFVLDANMEIVAVRTGMVNQRQLEALVERDEP